jgi:predicted HAD superfamily phosphohydrolase
MRTIIMTHEELLDRLDRAVTRMRNSQPGNLIYEVEVAVAEETAKLLREVTFNGGTAVRLVVDQILAKVG